MSKLVHPTELAKGSPDLLSDDGVQKGAWRPHGLVVANELRAQNRYLPKIEIARVISASVRGAPRNVETIASWLTKREQAGELPTPSSRA